MAKQKRPWRFFIEGLLVGFVLTVILIVAVPRMLREQQRYASHHPDTTPTSVTYTGDPYHIAIYGRGYFEFELPSGEKAYSRISEFKQGQGRLVSIHSYPLTSLEQPRELFSTDVWADGTVYPQSPYSFKNIVQNSFLSLYLFDDSSELNDIGDGYYQPTAASGKPIEVKPYGHTGAGALLQGWKLERSQKYGTPDHQVVNQHYNGPEDYPSETIVESRLDTFAIEGRGFAAVLQPSGRIGYTRILELAFTPNGRPVRRFPPTMPYHKFSYPGELEKSKEASYPYLVGLPIIKSFDGEFEKNADLRADPFAFAEPLSDQAETITISMQYGVRRGHHPYAFKNLEGVWHSFESLTERGIQSIDDVPIFTNELGRPFHVPLAHYVSTLDEIENIQLFDFENPSGLRYRLNGVYEQTDRSGEAKPLSTQDAERLKRGFINQVEAITP